MNHLGDDEVEPLLGELGIEVRVLGERAQARDLAPVSYTHLDVYKRQADAVRNQLAQVGAEHAQDAGAHQVGAPDQQRHGCQEIEEMLHENRCFFFL